MSASDADLAPAFDPAPVPLAARGIQLEFAPSCGIISAFQVTDQGRAIAMMHRAPWAGTHPVLPAGAPPHQACLEGDFFCAPFSDASIDRAPLHGWPANGLWHVSRGSSPATLMATLDHTVMGATVTKTLTLSDDHPFLYQCHRFEGGVGAIAAANHAMVALPNGGLLRFSPKRWFETPADPPESDPARGRSALRYPARSIDPRLFPAKDGGTVDLTHYPFGPAHEDFVIGLESPDSPLGWTAITRPTEGDLYLSLRHPRRLPMTMLWHSNGGRDYAPWNGTHTACLGIEDGVAVPMLALTSQEDPGLFARSGQEAALVLVPTGPADVRHITGCIAWPTGEPVRDIRLSGNHLIVTGDGGYSRTLPVDGAFLQL